MCQAVSYLSSQHILLGLTLDFAKTEQGIIRAVSGNTSP